jgi:hypothetical protein
MPSTRRPAAAQHPQPCLPTAHLRARLRRSKLKADLLTTVKVNWTLWVPAQYLNFRYVPVNLQVSWLEGALDRSWRGAVPPPLAPPASSSQLPATPALAAAPFAAGACPAADWLLAPPQVLASNTTALIWNTYMSWASHRPAAQGAKHA